MQVEDMVEEGEGGDLDMVAEKGWMVGMVEGDLGIPGEGMVQVEDKVGLALRESAGVAGPAE